MTDSTLIAAGSKAPDFMLPSVRGERVALARLLGEGPVLVVFVEADCPTSRLTLSRLEPLREPFAAAGARIVAVHQDPPHVAARVMRAAQARFDALSEAPPYEVSRAWGLQSVPTAVLVDRDGTAREVIVGWDAEDFDRVAAWIARAAAAPPARVTREHPVRKPGCGARNTYEGVAPAAGDGGFDELEDLFDRGWTDGLPVIPPTRERVDRMLGGADPARSLGPVPPGLGEATLERVAACAVLAGCRPEYFPVVVAAVEAALDPAFNLHGMTNTTHSCGPVVIVNGPVRTAIGMNAGINAMGGWNRANATIGRALRLVIGLTGAGAPGGLDRSAQGQPGKISFCFAENEEASPWEPLSVARGIPPGVGAVTIYTGDGPMGISDHYSREPERIIDTLALAGSAIWSPSVFPIAAQTVFAICPEHAESFRVAGWDRKSVAARIFEASQRPVASLRRGEQSPVLSAFPEDMMLAKWGTPDEIVLVVVGGEAGRFSSVLPPWVGYGLGSEMVTKPINPTA